MCSISIHVYNIKNRLTFHMHNKNSIIYEKKGFVLQIDIAATDR